MPEVDEATEQTEQPEETHDGFIRVDKHQKDVNVQHKKFRDQERSRVEAEKRADSIQKELDELKGQNATVAIPPVPDQYSETYAADVASRDDAIRKQADQDAAQQRQEAQRKEKDEARVASENQAINKRIAEFDSNMVTHGLNPVETKAAADTVIAYGISNTFQDVLLEDPDGPLFVTYLSQNPVELGEMNGMSTLQLVNHLNGDIRQKASLLKPQTSNAPEPPITLSGGGVPEMKEGWEKGAKYDFGTG